MTWVGSDGKRGAARKCKSLKLLCPKQLKWKVLDKLEKKGKHTSELEKV